MKFNKRLKNIVLMAAFLPFMAGSADAALVWQKVQSVGGAGGGSGTACYYRMNVGTFKRIAPVTTTFQYLLVGGGAGAGGTGGNGGATKILVNGTAVATANGGVSGGAAGQTIQGTLTVDAGDLFEIYLGGGGGGRGQCGGGGADGRAYPGAANLTQTSNGGGGGSLGQNGTTSTGVGGIGTVNGAFGEGGAGSYGGGSAGGIDLTYSASGCWINL